MTTHNRVTATSPAGSIYDLGYRHYEGRRNGRLYAMWSLFVESFRGVWGFGRPMTSKLAPFILAGLYALPALFQLAFSSVIQQQVARTGQPVQLLTYAGYFSNVYFLVFFFCVAQAPELVCRDQRYQVLPLYFTRSMGRIEYALARLGSLAASLFIILMIPVVALFVGDILMKPDTFAAIGDEWPQALPAIPASVLIALGLGAISLAVSSFSPRRAYSAIGVVAYILLMEAIPAILASIGQTANWPGAGNLPLLEPVTSLIGATSWIFGKPLDPENFQGTLASSSYAAAAVASIVVMSAILFWRYRKLPA